MIATNTESLIAAAAVIIGTIITTSGALWLGMRSARRENKADHNVAAARLDLMHDKLDIVHDKLDVHVTNPNAHGQLPPE